MTIFNSLRIYFCGLKYVRELVCITLFMESLEKKNYEAPAIVVVELKVEGIICSSGESHGMPGHGNGYERWY